jgi:hypothetical protein
LVDALAIAQADGKCVFCQGKSLIGGLSIPFGSRREIQLEAIRAGIVDAETELGAGIVLAGSLAHVFEFVFDFTRTWVETTCNAKEKVD